MFKNDTKSALPPLQASPLQKIDQHYRSKQTTRVRYFSLQAAERFITFYLHFGLSFLTMTGFFLSWAHRSARPSFPSHDHDRATTALSSSTRRDPNGSHDRITWHPWTASNVIHVAIVEAAPSYLPLPSSCHDDVLLLQDLFTGTSQKLPHSKSLVFTASLRNKPRQESHNHRTRMAVFWRLAASRVDALTVESDVGGRPESRSNCRSDASCT